MQDAFNLQNFFFSLFFLIQMLCTVPHKPGHLVKPLANIPSPYISVNKLSLASLVNI